MYKKQELSSETKPEFFRLLAAQLDGLLTGETDWLANLANASALLFDQMPQINWAGFYLEKEGQLVLGPFQGKPACVRIQPGKGVCGTAFAEKTCQVVADVHAFPGHIACDADSRSEIVIPFYEQSGLSGVLDVDSPLTGRFDEEDRQGLTQYLQVLWSHLG